VKLPTLIKLEWYKQKKSWLWLFLFVIPVGTTLAMFLDFSIRYDFLLQDGGERGYSSWDVLLLENHRILGWGMFLPMFIAIIYALLYQVEMSQQNWKHYLSLPVRKESVYLSKFLTGFMCSLLLILLNMLGLILVGLILEFPEAVDWNQYVRYVFNQAIMILAVASIQNWFSSFFTNHIIPVVIGFAGVILSSIILFQIPEELRFFPYLFPFYTDGLVNEVSSEVMSYSIIFMVVFLVFGGWQFKQKDVL
jgi:hypothetical protein